jgi:hypothetical protein
MSSSVMQRARNTGYQVSSLVWLDSGHFVLDENAPKVAAEIKAMFST